MMSDRQLVTAFLDGDQAAFEQLHARHNRDLLAIARRIIADAAPEDAEDVVQEAWFRAIQAFPRFRWRSALRTWLVRITLNLSWSVLRERSRCPSAAPGAEWVLVRRRRLAIHPFDVSRAISRLPTGFRRVLVLYAIGGYSHREIGRACGIQTGTSKSQLSRARDSVRAFLAAS